MVAIGHSGRVRCRWNRERVRDVQGSVKRWSISLLAVGLLYGCGSSASETQPDVSASSAGETAQTGTLATTAPQSTLKATTVMSSAPTSTHPEMDIVAVAAVARLTKDNSFGGAPIFDSVTIVDRFGSPRSDGFLDVGSDSSVIGLEVRAAVEQSLTPMSVTWVGNLSDVIGTGQDIPTYEEVGPVLTLSSPIVDGDQAAITTGLWCGGTCGAGGTYTLKWTESQGWFVTGTEGLQWVS